MHDETRTCRSEPRPTSGAVLQTLAARRADVWAIREMDVAVSSVVPSGLAVRQRDGAPLVSRDGDRTVVWLDGECDIATVFVLDEALTKAISDDRADLIVDLSGVTFIGTVTIDALIQAGLVLDRQSRRLTVRSPSRCARRLLAVCGHSDLIE